MNEAPLDGPALRQLKSMGQKLKPVVHLGKGGLTEALVGTVVQALADHELIKVKFDAWKEQKKTLAPELASKTGSSVVQQVGNVLVLYREHPDPARRRILGRGAKPPAGRSETRVL